MARPRAIIATGGTSGTPGFGGSTWVRLQYLLGLERLGFEVHWVDGLRRLDPAVDPHSLEYLAERFHRTAEEFGFDDRYCIVYADGERHLGMTEDELTRLARSTDLLISISGRLRPSSPLMRIPRRAYIDVDPGYTQIWAQQVDMALDLHTAHFTTGQNVGSDAFRLPTGGRTWHPILPPVVLDLWPPVIDPGLSRVGTVADWRGSQRALYELEYYGTKREEFIRHLRVPIESGQTIELALCIGQKDFEDLGLLDGHGWVVLDPYLYAGDPASYQEFVQRSRAEFSVAKHGYVKSNSGWVSDRTACYLASGKPAIVQSTGFEHALPTGAGLLTFRDVPEAVAAIREVNADYERHAHAARALAERHFDSRVVLSRLLDVVGC